jgi:AAHS family 4-hydroxybenzoate transporter-like MFS transporter
VAAKGTVIDVSGLIDEQSIGWFHVRILLLCGAALFMDGFDVQSIGYVGPSLAKDWNLAPGALGPVFGSGVVGLILGALVFAPLADRIGRRPTLILCVLAFGTCTLLTAWADSLSHLIVMRFITGLGLGGAMPNASALTSEYSPARRRSIMVVVVFCGYSIGAACCGLIAAHVVPLFGWRAIFYLGGSVSLIVAPLLIAALPESIRILTRRGTEAARVLYILRRLYPSLAFDAEMHFIERGKRLQGSPVRHLFRDGRTPATILLWVTFFMSLLDLFLLSQWLPTVVNNVGFSVETAVIATSLFQGGGAAGALLLGWLMDRLGGCLVLGVTYTLAAIFIILIGLAGADITMVMLGIFGAGVCIVGGQIGLNALAASFYPAVTGSTGVGWALGMGRFGSFVGPVVGGIMLSHGLDTKTILLCASLPALISASAIAGLSKFPATAAEPTAEPSVAAVEEAALLAAGESLRS